MSCSWTPTRKATWTTCRNCCRSCARRTDHRPQHEHATSRSQLRQGCDDEPGIGDADSVARRHWRGGDDEETRRQVVVRTCRWVSNWPQVFSSSGRHGRMERPSAFNRNANGVCAAGRVRDAVHMPVASALNRQPTGLRSGQSSGRGACRGVAFNASPRAAQRAELGRGATPVASAFNRQPTGLRSGQSSGRGAHAGGVSV